MAWHGIYCSQYVFESNLFNITGKDSLPGNGAAQYYTLAAPIYHIVPKGRPQGKPYKLLAAASQTWRVKCTAAIQMQCISPSRPPLSQCFTTRRVRTFAKATHFLYYSSSNITTTRLSRAGQDPSIYLCSMHASPAARMQCGPFPSSSSITTGRPAGQLHTNTMQCGVLSVSDRSVGFFSFFFSLTPGARHYRPV